MERLTKMKELNEQTICQIKKARARMKKGNFLTEREAKKKLNF